MNTLWPRRLAGLLRPVRHFSAPGSVVLFVRDLPRGVTPVSLRSAFAAVCSVRGVQVPLDKAGESRGFGFVTVEAADVDKVRYEMNGAFIGDRQISVELRESTGKALSAQLVSSATAADVLALFDTKGDDFNDECFAASLYRLGVLGPSPEASSPLLRKLLEGAASSLRNASAPWEPRPLVHACWGAAKLGVEAPALFEAMAAASLKKIATFTPQELANAAWAYATAGESHRALFEAIAAEAPKKMATFKPQDLANIVWAFSKTGFEAPTLFETVAAEAPKKMAFFNANHLANTVWAFATAGVEAPALFKAVAAEAPKKIATFFSQELANTVWAFAKTGVKAPALFRAVAAEAPKKIAMFNSQDLANTVWAYATAGFAASALFDAIAVRIEAKIGDFSPDELSQWHQVYVLLRTEAPQHRLTLLLSRHEAELRAAPLREEPSPSRSRDVSTLRSDDARGAGRDAAEPAAGADYVGATEPANSGESAHAAEPAAPAEPAAGAESAAAILPAAGHESAAAALEAASRARESAAAAAAYSAMTISQLRLLLAGRGLGTTCRRKEQLVKRLADHDALPMPGEAII